MECKKLKDILLGEITDLEPIADKKKEEKKETQMGYKKIKDTLLG